MSDCSTNAYAQQDATAWLKAHRCPWCRFRKRERCSAKVRQTAGGGWHCWGYRCDDERRWA